MVVLLVNGYGWQPLPAALVATTLPVLAGLAERIGRGLPPLPAAASGGVSIALGLAVLGFLPGPRTSLIVAGLALCGAGLGLAAQPLGRLALAGEHLAREAAWTVVARHAGLVAALVVATPVLVSTLTELETEAEAVGGDLVLESRLPLADKVPALIELAESADRAEASIPDVEAVLAPYETGSGVVADLGGRLADVLEDLVTRAFREPVPRLRLLRAPRRAPSPRASAGAAVGCGGRRPCLSALALAGGGVALAADFRLGALDDPASAADPCTEQPAFPGSGVDETTQRIALAALAGAACELDTSRAGLLRALTADEPLPWPRAEVEEAVRTGLVAAVDAERESGRLDGVLGLILRTAAANAPLDWILDALEVES